MKLNNKWLLSALMLTFTFALVVPAGFAAIDGGYVGSAACGVCHTDQYNTFVQSGHPYKVRFTNGATPTVGSDPLSYLLIGYTPTLATLSTANNNLLRVDDGTGRLDWSAVSYVIGGWGWKARWGMLDGSDLDGDGINDTGYVWTGSGAQYNLLTDTFSGYNAGTDKKYSCAICHNTNGTSSEDAGCSTALGSGRTEPWASSGRTPAAPGGFRSEWTFSGVQCEACHGAGETHAGAPSASNIVKNTSKDVCGKCHIRSTNTNGFGGECGGDASPSILTNGAPTAAGGFGSHHQQYNEMVGYNGDGAHASLDCVTCHDPHMRSHKVTTAVAGALGITDNALSAEARGAVVSCNNCHYGKDSNGTANIAGHSALACIDCHMAETVQSATSQSGTWGKKGDVKAHIFKIDPAQTANTRVNADTKTIATNYVTVAYACGKCHDSAVYGSSINGPTSVGTAQTAATNYHGAIASIDNGYVGSNVCGTCHTQNYDDFVQSGHPYKVRMTNGATPTPATDPLSALLSSTMPNTADLLNPNNETNVKVTDINGKLDWSAVSYVIGGFGWKARWGVKDTVDNSATGYIWSSSGTHDTQAQFNMLAADPTLDPKSHRGDWSTYGSATKTYSCAVCHNTNGTSSVDALCSTPLGSGRTEPWASSGLTSTNPGGFRSEWTFSGVQCEACHGAGADHATSASKNNIAKNLRVTFDGTGMPGTGGNDYEICAKCHIRTNNNSLGYGAECGGNSNEAILTGGSSQQASGFESHHQQFNQVFGYNGDGAHATLECTACHNPHKRAHKVTSAIATALGIADNDQSAEARGAVASCTSCHGNKDLKYNMGNITCVDCHMGSTTQSATNEKNASGWGKLGDVAGHIFKIDPAATDVTRSPAGKSIAKNAISVDFACGRCHDSYMNDAVSPALTQAQAQAFAVNIHNSKPTANFTTNVEYSASYSINFNAAASTCPPGYTCTYSWDFNNGEGTATGVAATFAFAGVGPYPVTLTVTTDGNTSNSITKSVSPVAINAAPVVCGLIAGTPVPSLGINSTGLAVSFTDCSSDPEGSATVYVNWGDGKPVQAYSMGAAAFHTYSRNGTYTITHWVQDSGGLKSTESLRTSVPVKGTVTVTTTADTPSALVRVYKSGVLKAQGYTNASGNYTSPAVLEAGGLTFTITKTGKTFDCDAVTIGNQSVNVPVTLNSTTDCIVTP